MNYNFASDFVMHVDFEYFKNHGFMIFGFDKVCFRGSISDYDKKFQELMNYCSSYYAFAYLRIPPCIISGLNDPSWFWSS